jgi:pyridoxamine 5'-phosphate oxidase
MRAKAMEQEILDQITALIDETQSIVVCSLDQDEYPNAKAMFKTEHEGLKTFLFSTNTSSMRVQQFQRNEKACIYFLGQSKINGLMLVGKMQVCTDRDLKARLWVDGCEKYYPLGIDDPDYCVLKFTAEKGNYYFNLSKHPFEIA